MLDIEKKVRDIIAENLYIPVESIKNSDSFSGLGADSLDELEILMAIEEEFGIEINSIVETVQEIIDYLEKYGK